MASSCAACGGELPEVLYRRTITCTYCSAQLPNPVPLHVGDEVLTGSELGLELSRVGACEGPDAITVGDRVLRLEDVIPVTRATAALAAGASVYQAGLIGWALTFTASVPRDGIVVVKNADPEFRSTFFDKQVNLTELRIDARPSELGGAHAVRSLVMDRVSKGFSRVWNIFFTVMAIVIALALLRGSW